MNRSFTSLVKLIPRYFILLDAFVNGIPFLGCFLLGNTSDASVLVPYPATLMSSFISCSCFLMKSLGVSICRIRTFVNIDAVTSSSLIQIPSISFSCLIALAEPPA